MLLDDPNITTMSWHPSGNAVMVDKRCINAQVKVLFPECFGKDKFTAIRQNLGAHGFKSACKRQNVNDGVWKKYNHVLNSNKFLHIYEHPLFRRGKPEHDILIKRLPIQRRKPKIVSKIDDKDLKRENTASTQGIITRISWKLKSLRHVNSCEFSAEPLFQELALIFS